MVHSELYTEAQLLPAHLIVRLCLPAFAQVYDFLVHLEGIRECLNETPSFFKGGGRGRNLSHTPEPNLTSIKPRKNKKDPRRRLGTFFILAWFETEILGFYATLL